MKQATKTNSRPNNKADGTIVINTYSKWFNVLLVGICFLVLLAVRLQVNTYTTGDQPSYLAMDYALVHHHSLDLKSVYLNKEYYGFYPNPDGLLPQGNPAYTSLDHSEVHSPHGIGLPLFLLPGFLVKAKTGATFQMVALATLVVYLTWVWTKLVTKNRKAAYLASALLVTCYFFNASVGYIFPDLPIAAATLAALILFELGYTKTVHQIVIGLLLGFLVLLNSKDLVIALPLLLVYTYKYWQKEHKLPWLTVSMVALAVAFFFLTIHHWFGTFSPSQIADRGGSFGGNPILQISAMLFDVNRGLLVYNPILLLLFVGLPLWYKQHRESFLVTAVALVPSMAVLALYTGWNGGGSTPGRYLLDFLPVLIPALAFAIMRLRLLWQRAVIGVLATATFLISLDAIMMKFPLINPTQLFTRPPLFAQIQQHTGLVLDHLIPNYSTMTYVTTELSKHGGIKILACYAAVAALIVYGWLLSRSASKVASN